jgi:anti-sigma B factor antagonist
MIPLVRVLDEHVGDVAVVTVDGEVDAANARGVGERLRSSLTNHSHALVVDLTETSYIDSAGLNVLFALDLELRERRQRLHLVIRPGSPVARVAAITGLDGAVATHPGRDAALQAAR